MNIVMIDNYDSFTFNLVHLVKEMGANVRVLRNDCFELDELEAYDKIMLSPGPGIPSEAFGGTLVNLDEVFHGVQTDCRRTADDYLFEGLPARFPIGRYHSWVVDAATLPDSLECIAVSDERQVMALRHRSLDIRGLQFHPESVLTPDGAKIIANWLNH